MWLAHLWAKRLDGLKVRRRHFLWGGMKCAFLVQWKNGKMERWRDWRMTDVWVEVWSLSRMLSVPEGVVSPQTTAGFTQREREIRPSPLNIYDLGPHRFLATFFAVFRGGLALGDPHTLTDSRTSMHECSQIHSDIHTCIHCLWGGWGRGKKGNKSWRSLEWKVVNVAKSKRSTLAKEKI